MSLGPLTERVVAALLDTVTGEHEATWTMSQILDELSYDFTWGAVCAGLDEVDDADYTVILLFGFIYDNSQAVAEVRKRFDRWLELMKEAH